MTETRKAFHEELASLTADTLALAAMAMDAVRDGTTALLEADLVGAQRVIVRDRDMDALTHAIENNVYSLLALQQPMAVDLRILVIVLRVVRELERVGDLMVNVAKATRRLYPRQLDGKLRELLAMMRDQAIEQLRVSLEAFEAHDPVRAAALADMDDVMDDLQKELFRVVFATRADDDVSVQQAVQVSLLGRYFERIADHAVNIGERVEYLVTGHHQASANEQHADPVP